MWPFKAEDIALRSLKSQPTDSDGGDENALRDSRKTLEFTNEDDVSAPLLPTTSANGSKGLRSLPKRRFRLLLWPRRHPRLAGTGLLAFILLFLLPFLQFFLYTDPGINDVFAEKPFIPHPHSPEPDVAAFSARPTNSSTSTDAEAIQQELDQRFISLGLPPSIDLPCAITPTEYTRFSHLASRKGRTLIALNLFNSQHVIPVLARALLTVSAFLGPHNVHIAVFENGSWDNTVTAMGHLAAALTALGVDHTILTDNTQTHWGEVDRIAQLAVFRNVVLEPLSSSNTTAFESIVYINDVYVCPRDVLELLHQRIRQVAHATCGLDYRWRRPYFQFFFGTGPKFYDNWVSRTRRGGMFRSRLDALGETRHGLDELFDQAGDELSRDRFASALPLPVYSCWNGLAVLDARPFLGIGLGEDESDVLNPIEGVEGNGTGLVEPVRFRGADRLSGECAASECKLVAKDFWKRGFDRWVLVPSVHVTYDITLYNQTDLATLTDLGRNATEEQERINWVGVESPEEVICWPYHPPEGVHVEWWWRRILEKPW